MPEYHLPDSDAPSFKALDSFTQGYIEALFFTNTEPGTTRAECFTDSGEIRPEWLKGASEGHHSEIPGDYGPEDLAPDTLARIVADCSAFQAEAADLLALAYDREDYSAIQAGRDFWFNRCGHGVGFWSREQLEPQGDEWETTQIRLDQWTPELRATRERLKNESLGELLSKAAKAWGNLDPLLDDSGKVCLG